MDFKSSFKNLCLWIGVLVHLHLIIDMVILRSSHLQPVLCLLCSTFLSSVALIRHYLNSTLISLLAFNFYIFFFFSYCSRDHIGILNLSQITQHLILNCFRQHLETLQECFFIYPSLYLQEAVVVYLDLFML